MRSSMFPSRPIAYYSRLAGPRRNWEAAPPLYIILFNHTCVRFYSWEHDLSERKLGSISDVPRLSVAPSSVASLHLVTGPTRGIDGGKYGNAEWLGTA